MEPIMDGPAGTVTPIESVTGAQVITAPDAPSGGAPEPASAAAILERGDILLFPARGFSLTADELALMTPAVSDGKAKNISRDPAGAISGAVADAQTRARLADMMGRFALASEALLLALAPEYRGFLE